MKEINTYKTQTTWRKILAPLAKESQLKYEDLPKEEFWDWNGNQIHLDRYDNPKSKYKIILQHGVFPLMAYSVPLVVLFGKISYFNLNSNVKRVPLSVLNS
jgi:hypothetical protein